jgi:hypothetical protein
MNYLKPPLIILSIVTSLYLLFDVFNDVNIAATKDNYRIGQQITKIVESNNIDSVRVSLFKHFKNTRQIKSDIAESRVKLILCFVIAQFLLLILILRKR